MNEGHVLSAAARRNRRMENIAGYLFLSPWLIGLIVFTIIPIFASLYFSFTDYNMLTAPGWVGLDNYSRLFSDPRFIKSLKVTFKFVLWGVPFKLVFALLVAVLLNKEIGFLGLYRAVYYLPSLLGSCVAVSILWRQIFNKEGLFNAFLSIFGIQGMNWIAPRHCDIYGHRAGDMAIRISNVDFPCGTETDSSRTLRIGKYRWSKQFHEVFQDNASSSFTHNILQYGYADDKCLAVLQFRVHHQRWNRRSYGQYFAPIPLSLPEWLCILQDGLCICDSLGDSCHCIDLYDCTIRSTEKMGFL